MPSRAAVEFGTARANAQLLVAAASLRGAPPVNAAGHKEACLHAALAMLVAAWEAYLERLVREVQREIADASHLRLSAVLTLLTSITEKDVRRFNTPNAENTRDLLIVHTGYDPINDWTWPAGALSGPQTRNRLDEILKVRHSFAHGFSIPVNVTWVVNRGRPGVLNIGALRSVDQFIAHMVAVTEIGMKAHLLTTFGVAPGW